MVYTCIQLIEKTNISYLCYILFVTFDISLIFQLLLLKIVPGHRRDVSTGYALVWHAARSSEIDVGTSTETQHASLVRILKPPY